jgi:hypothetical protein
MIILDMKLEGRLQIAAALALLKHSRLVRWVPNGPGFVAAQREAFEATWPKEVYPVFGRVICWILFSAGAELLAKGVCLACAIDLREPARRSGVPTRQSGCVGCGVSSKQ